MRVGEMLLKAGVVTEPQLTAALAEQHRTGGKVGQILVRMGALSEELLVMALCRQLELPRADLDALTSVPELLKQRLDHATCERYRIVPIAFITARRAVQLAMSDPFDVVALDELTRLLGTRLEPFLAGDSAISVALRRLYGPLPPPAPADEPETFDRSRTPTELSYTDRVDEQVRFVRAVAELLIERGVIQHDDLKR